MKTVGGGGLSDAGPLDSPGRGSSNLKRCVDVGDNFPKSQNDSSVNGQGFANVKNATHRVLAPSVSSHLG